MIFDNLNHVKLFMNGNFHQILTQYNRHRIAHTRGECFLSFQSTVIAVIEGILPKGPYLPCVSMAGRALSAGYHRYNTAQFVMILHEALWWQQQNFQTQNRHPIPRSHGWVMGCLLGEFWRKRLCYNGTTLYSIPATFQAECGPNITWSRSSVKFQGHMGQKIADFYPNWAFPDCNSSLNSPMATKWCTKLEVGKGRCPIVFQGHLSNFMVAQDKKIADFDPNWVFPYCNSSLNSPMAEKWCTKLEVS